MSMKEMSWVDLERSLRGKTVLLTGHTGFKGGWMSLWLRMLGAHVVGIALPPLNGPTFFGSVQLDKHIDHRIADIRSPDAFAAKVAGVEPDVLIHMAAQALVRPSYQDPVATFMTNAIGTAVVLDAARKIPTLKAMVVVTSDKCYRNDNSIWGYREGDAMGGADPYSASKGCTELVASSFRSSFFSADGGPYLATARAGNVFGGGDWSEDRLVPDLIKAFSSGQTARIRNPLSVRPWQHVLEPLHGYLRLVYALLNEGDPFAKGYNFGPDAEGTIDVATLAGMFAEAWGDNPQIVFEPDNGPPEATLLTLDSTLARTELNWRPVLTLNEMVELTVRWHSKSREPRPNMSRFTSQQIELYMSKKNFDPAMKSLNYANTRSEERNYAS